MRDDNQFEQLMLQYEQLRNGANDIMQMIQEEDYDGAITLIKSREPIFLNCKCMRKYLELTPEQETQANTIFEEIRELEKQNIDFLSQRMEDVSQELKKTQQSEKIQMAYEFDEDQKGSILNIKD
jgi:hypothetical protein